MNVLFGPAVASLWSVALSWLTTYVPTLNSNGTHGLYSVRLAIPASAISTSGNTIRLTFSASTVGNLTINNASIGERSASTADTLATPVEILFSGGSGVAISSGATAVSDPLSFSIDETKSYIVVMDFSSTAGTRTSASATGTLYQKAATASYATSAVTGFTTVGSTYAFVVSKIEVFA